ncbi:DUF488 domain-containing protein [Desulfatitalea tepidiphila]|uniref:DUF488 domain-containing protein n=1 Tax=Desulfatitalea tepidiphila TaxID=1185843 RepID=UPI000975A502|nr:DUF488 domain-containing protein [Desulfatitalea tepidiphila]
MHRIYTIGHSNHETEHFIRLLKMHGITAVCDVRSEPYSKYNPQFNRNSIKQSLGDADVEYFYLGNRLGAWIDDPTCYIDGIVQYDRVGKTKTFRDGLDWIKIESNNYNLALMCGEKEPVGCHRMYLVCRHIRGEFEIMHILADGNLENNRKAEQRMMKDLKIPEVLTFDEIGDPIERAYVEMGKISALKHPKNKHKNYSGRK